MFSELLIVFFNFLKLLQRYTYLLLHNGETNNIIINKHYNQRDHSPDNVKFPDISRTVRGTRHVKCYSYHARTSVTVSVGIGMQQYMI